MLQDAAAPSQDIWLFTKSEERLLRTILAETTAAVSFGGVVLIMTARIASAPRGAHTKCKPPPMLRKVARRATQRETRRASQSEVMPKGLSFFVIFPIFPAFFKLRTPAIRFSRLHALQNLSRHISKLTPFAPAHSATNSCARGAWRK